MDDQKRIFLAVILSGLILFGWQFYFAPEEVKTENSSRSSDKQQVSANNNSTVVAENLNNKKLVNNNPVNEVSETLEVWELNNEQYSLKINSKLELISMRNNLSQKDLVDISGVEKSFLKVTLFKAGSGQTSVFTKEQSSQSEIELINSNGDIVKIMLVGAKIKFLVSSTFEKATFNFNAVPGEKNQFNKRSYIYLGKEFELVELGEQLNKVENIQAFGLDFDYHFFGIGFPSGRMPTSVYNKANFEFQVESSLPKVESGLKEFDLFLVKKEYDTLKALGSNLHLTIDFGFFSILALPIFRVLQWCHDLIPNWGIAIILLTLIMRLVTLPLQYKSAKSMKKVQKVQPELAKLKEKYKDEPQKMQKESMALFKKAGANPLSGCFPLLLQMPIFFAFYKVLYNTVELVGAPFIFWITDLSIKDPFYVLPVLMSLAMFLQQKLTPTTVADPTQQKVMLFMPLIFGFIMKDLPSGLNLYIFVSTIFGIIQQLVLFNRIKE